MRGACMWKFKCRTKNWITYENDSKREDVASLFASCALQRVLKTKLCEKKLRAPTIQKRGPISPKFIGLEIPQNTSKGQDHKKAFCDQKRNQQLMSEGTEPCNRSDLEVLWVTKSVEISKSRNLDLMPAHFIHFVCTKSRTKRLIYEKSVEKFIIT